MGAKLKGTKHIPCCLQQVEEIPFARIYRLSMEIALRMIQSTECENSVSLRLRVTSRHVAQRKGWS